MSDTLPSPRPSRPSKMPTTPAPPYYEKNLQQEPIPLDEIILQHLKADAEEEEPSCE